MCDEKYRQLARVLPAWYMQNRRALPWRQTRDPYRIWLSEIMLQQTRVEAVKGYYHRFLEALPTVEALSMAEDDRLHKLWEGLGYYSRVRNLKKAACQIMQKHNGVFPQDYEDILELPGVGAYTAGAIASIAFDQPRAAVDGNVLRVISRLTEDTTPVDTPAFQRQVRQSLEQVYPVQAGVFTQALMELGATVCGPNRKPRCEQCPCLGFCDAAAHGTAEQLPVKKPKAKRREEQRTVLILSCEGRYALKKRPEQGLLAGMYQFPDISGWLDAQQAVQLVQNWGLRPRQIYRQVRRQHIFTHIQWDMQGFYMEVETQTPEYLWLTSEEMEQKAALPTAWRQFWEDIKNV